MPFICRSFPAALPLTLAALVACAGDDESPGDRDAGDQGDSGDPADARPVVPGEPPSGPDTSEPYPIDRGDDDETPGTYKGLWLRLVDNGEPVVTPVRGVVGVVCIGMSNSSQECEHFIATLRGELEGEVNGEVRVVNCAVGGHAIETWINPADDDILWDACTGNKLADAGIAPDQVRVIYHKAANMFTTDGPGEEALPPYPDPDSDYFNFIDNLDAFAARVSEKLASVQAVYTTSRSYGGYANKPSRGEPLSYEEGHALNSWLADHPAVDGVWNGWGPYIWAPDCASGVTNASEVCYQRQDYQADGIHPGNGAKDKITAMIHARLSDEAWYAP